MSYNSCNRNTMHNSGMNARNNYMYKGNQSGRGRYVNRSVDHTCRDRENTMSDCCDKHEDCGCVVENDSCCKKEEHHKHECMEQRFPWNYDSCNQATCPVDTMMVAMAYVPWQQWGEIKEYDRALQCGTIFEDLYKPWIGRACE